MNIPLRAGIIGLGVGEAHARGYTGNYGAELVAICDLNEVRLHQVGDKLNIPRSDRFTDYHEMLAQAQLDIVSVALPNALHAEVTITALKAGVHVLCEKPMATSLPEVQAMLSAAQEANKRLMIAYNWRYRDDVQWIRKVVASGQIGQVFHVDASWRRETGIPGSGWFGDKALAGGGALIDLGVHMLDMSMWMLDFPAIKTVTGNTRMVFGPRGMKTWGRQSGQPLDRPFSVDDGSIGFIRFADNTDLILQATWAEHRPPQDDIIRLEIQGTEGTIVLNITNYRKEDALRMYTEIEGQPVTIIPAIRWESVTPHEALIRDLLVSLRDNTPPPTDGYQGELAVRVLTALYESAQTGHEITL